MTEFVEDGAHHSQSGSKEERVKDGYVRVSGEPRQR
jgi:hypothetical protein